MEVVLEEPRRLREASPAETAPPRVDEIPPAAPPAPTTGPGRLSSLLRHVAGPLVVALLLAAACVVLAHQIRAYRYEDVRRAVTLIPQRRIALAFVLTLLSYLLLTCYDTLALRYVGRELPYRRRALASFLGYAFSHNVGASWLGGAAPRYRLYSAWGLSAAEITRLVLFTGFTLWPGALLIASAALLIDPGPSAAYAHLPASAAPLLSALLLSLLAAYPVLCGTRRAPLRFRGWELPLPTVSMALAQVGLSALDWIAVAAVLYVLLPAPAPIAFLPFVGLFTLAGIAGVLSHVPGGLGVFESILLLALAGRAPAASLVASLLAYRAIYYLLPLAVATATLAAQELAQRRERLVALGGWLGRRMAPAAPPLLAFAVFVAGATLVLSGATPRPRGRLASVAHVLPLGLMELSHFLASLTGLGLLLLAHGLRRRLDAAYHLTIALLLAGAAFSLLHALSYEEAFVLTSVLVVLVPCRRHFYRRSRLLATRFTPDWLVAVGLVLAGAVALGFFAYRNVAYANELWWQFELSGNASRFLRATFGVATATFFFAAARLMSPAPPRPGVPEPSAAEAARAIVAASPRASSNLALLGDKTFLFSDDRRAMIMYAASGRSWVSMGDPIGPPEQRAELVWRFRETCDRADAHPVFYEAGPEALPLYLDVGLYPLKIGECARIRLPSFSLEGHARKDQRYIVRRLERDGLGFEVLPPERLRGLMPELRAVSDEWLASKNTREKRFSLGLFAPSYVERFPVAIARREGAIVAFANLWSGAEREELSVDLMRYGRAAPPSVMEFLLLRLLLWAKDEGYGWFNLGMAPFSGLGARASAPLWQRMGALAFRHGEHFYNLQGVRRFKEKFDPIWEPRYLVCPAGLALPRVLADVAALVSGGLRGFVAK